MCVHILFSRPQASRESGYDTLVKQIYIKFVKLSSMVIRAEPNNDRLFMVAERNVFAHVMYCRIFFLKLMFCFEQKYLTDKYLLNSEYTVGSGKMKEN